MANILATICDGLAMAFGAAASSGILRGRERTGDQGIGQVVLAAHHLRDQLADSRAIARYCWRGLICCTRRKAGQAVSGLKPRQRLVVILLCRH